MSKWINNSLNERRLMLQEVAKEHNISQKSVEKDWWVTMTLKALFQTTFESVRTICGTSYTIVHLSEVS